MKFAVIGGDLRQVRVSEELHRSGHEVKTYALGCSAFEASSLRSAAEGAEVIVLPLPCESTEGLINTPLSEKQVRTEEITGLAEPGTVIFAGKAGKRLALAAEERGLRLADYSGREEFTVKNALLTAEGALDVLLHELPVSLCGLKCLVIGFGRIGKITAHRLKGCCARVTVSARKAADLEWIRAYGYEPAVTGNFDEILPGLDVIVNTVPALVLDKTRLSLLKKDCLCLDLASNPGGMDLDAAAELGLNAIWELGIPGRFAPEAAGIAVKDTICNVLKEWGMS